MTIAILIILSVNERHIQAKKQTFKRQNCINFASWYVHNMHLNMSIEL